MRSISSALAANGVWYVLFGLFVMFTPGSLASDLGLGVPNHGDFYIAFGAAAMIGLGVTLASLARNFTPAAVGGVVLANFIVILTILYWLVIAKMNLSTTGAIILWVAVILLILITIAESTLLNQRRRTR